MEDFLMKNLNKVLAFAAIMSAVGVIADVNAAAWRDEPPATRKGGRWAQQYHKSHGKGQTQDPSKGNRGWEKARTSKRRDKTVALLHGNVSEMGKRSSLSSGDEKDGSGASNDDESSADEEGDEESESERDTELEAALTELKAALAAVCAEDVCTDVEEKIVRAIRQTIYQDKEGLLRIGLLESITEATRNLVSSALPGLIDEDFLSSHLINLKYTKIRPGMQLADNLAAFINSVKDESSKDKAREMEATGRAKRKAMRR
jgi:hypothetical protein